MSDLINTNRTRLSVRWWRAGYGERFEWWRVTTWKSSDHGMPRLESAIDIRLCGSVIVAKWRPDGKRRRAAQAGEAP